MAVFVQSPISSSWLQLEKETTNLCYDCINNQLKKWCSIDASDFLPKFFHENKEILPGHPLQWPTKDTFVKTSISLNGGKGGFGSMLRAIGAQIEKTTNREACRDLSGRRLRDINEEKRLKDWVAKQADREKEREERKKKKMDKLKEDFHHVFNDPEYFKTRSEVTDKVHDAVEQGISSEPTVKRKSTEPESSSRGKRIKRMDTMWIGVSDSESDSEEESGSDSTETENKVSSDSTTTEETQVAANDLKTETNEETGIKKDVLKAEEPISEETPTVSTTPESTQPEIPSKATISSTEPRVFSPINLEDINDTQELELLGLDHLKQDLQRRGLKCGGTLSDRASRLFGVKGLNHNEINPMLLAKPTKK